MDRGLEEGTGGAVLEVVVVKIWDRWGASALIYPLSAQDIYTKSLGPLN